MPEACNCIKTRDAGTSAFCEICEISKNTFSTEHLQTTVSDFS